MPSRTTVSNSASPDVHAKVVDDVYEPRAGPLFARELDRVPERPL